MPDLISMTLAEARDAIQAKTISSRELTGAFVKAIEAGRPLNAYITEAGEQAMLMADASDRRIALASKEGGEVGALEGLPLAIKDLFCTKGVRTTAASKILGNFVPPYESTVTQNLWDAGAVMLGKTNLDEFAMGSSNETSAFGPVFNPWRASNSNANLVPGGSSGGSSAAVAADLCLAATGTDTGGSIRQPAAVTGRVGLKPTYGRCSRFGIVAFASSLDQAGPMTKTVRDAAIMLKTMASVDAKDSTSVDIPVPDYEKLLEGGIKGLKVGIPKEYRIDGVPCRNQRAVDQGRGMAEGAGCRDRRSLAAPHQICAAHLLHRGPGGMFVQPGALRRHSFRPSRHGRP
jgi:aspartyl-tRNA(Asn)/glutamyl-tRNA(Gln) amidotransferase subunit A